MAESVGRLVLTRKPGEALWIGNARVFLVRIHSGEQVRLAIEAPLSVRVVREELLETEGGET